MWEQIDYELVHIGDAIDIQACTTDIQAYTKKILPLPPLTLHKVS